METLSFLSGSINGSMACINIIILDNLSFRRDRYFSLHIIAMERNVIVHGPIYVPVHIHDNEG